jgi:hypothetical protein
MPLEKLFTDTFTNGTVSGLWNPVGSVEESGDCLRIGSDDGDGVVGNYWCAPDFELTATVASDSAGIVGGTGTKRLDVVPLDEGVFLSVDGAGQGTLTLQGEESATSELSFPSPRKPVSLAVRYDASEDLVTATVDGGDWTARASLDASSAQWVSLAPVLSSEDSQMEVQEIMLRSSARFESPFDVTEYDRVVGAEMVTDPPSDPHFPKEAAAVKADGSIYLAIAGFNAPELAEGDNAFVETHHDHGVTKKDVTLWTADSPLGPFEQVGIVADRPMEGAFDESQKSGYQHAPGIAALDGELWVLYNNRETDEVHARHAPLDAIPSQSSGWSHEVLFGNASDVKSVISHEGRVHVVFSDAPFEKGQIVSGPNLLSLGDRTTIIDAQERLNTRYRDSIVAPHVLPAPDGGWYLLLEVRIGDGGFSYYGGTAVLYSDELRGEYAPRGATIIPSPSSRPGSEPDIWMAPGRLDELVLPDRTEGYHKFRAAHTTFCYAAGMSELATHDGHHFGYFEAEDDGGFHVMGFLA